MNEFAREDIIYRIEILEQKLAQLEEKLTWKFEEIDDRISDINRSMSGDDNDY